MTTHDVIVVGGGHAGIEAALATARLGLRTALLTHDPAEIGRMPCNPAIGGLGKGQLVREIDALGGQMALAIDAAGIQFRVLNRRKGPAVRSPRAQADKRAYQAVMRAAVTAQPGLEVIAGEAAGLLAADGIACGVRLAEGQEIHAHRTILAAGTFLRGLMHVGERQNRGGREGAESADGLSGDLAAHGFTLRRLKTGTPMRLRRDSVDYARLAPQAGDADPLPFSFRTGRFAPDQVLCHVTHTNERTHRLIRDNLHRSPLYAGIIAGRGPRYCPSIEDKVVRFADKERHHLFLEPEGRNHEEIYVNGLSTSLPADLQEAVVRSIHGLEEAQLARFGYAVEYDSVPSWQVGPTLEAKTLPGLFLAGQILGTSGYEEAAAQGLVAGLNAARALRGEPPFILPRWESYIGVLVDDLVTKEITEPYRMFTSRVERRLALRCDNTDNRLLPQAEDVGLLSAAEIEDRRAFLRETERLGRWVGAAWATEKPEGRKIGLPEWLRRPESELHDIISGYGPVERDSGAGAASLAPAGGHKPKTCNNIELIDCFNFSQSLAPLLRRRLCELVEADVKYAGYVARQERWLEQQRRLDHLELPPDLDYDRLAAISHEAREKLARMRPATLGQAGRIDGVRSADLAVLAVLVRALRRDSAERGAS